MLTILHPGLLTTIQDNGRFNCAHLGIPQSGPMDRQSADLANLLLGNEIHDALMECTFTGPKIKFNSSTIIAVTGAIATVYINEEETNASKPIQIKSGDVLSFSKFQKGCRLYIAVKGGIQSKVILGSRSICYTAGILRRVKKGDQLSYKSTFKNNTTIVSINRPIGNTQLTVSKGPEYAMLDESIVEKLFISSLKVHPSSNRMAFRVTHALDLSHTNSILSSGTIPGTIQLTPSGELIFLMRDCQTTGGYPRILQLSEQSICDLSQIMPGSQFSLKLTL